MRSTHTILLVLGLIAGCSLFAANEGPVNPLFIENKGQITYTDGTPAPEVLYTLHTGGFSLFVYCDGLSYQFAAPGGELNTPANENGPLIAEQEETKYTVSKGVHRFDVRFANANKQAKVRGMQATDYVENYYLNNQSPVTQVKSFQQIIVQDIYPGVDWKLYFDNGKLKYDFILDAGVDPAVIDMIVSGADDVATVDGQSLQFKTRFGEVTDGKLFCYQSDKSNEITSSFVLNDNHIKISIPQYNRSMPLVIDPSLDWSSFYGGFGEDAINAMAVDADSNIIFTGYTASSNAISHLGYQNSYIGGTYDCYIVKMDGNGNRIWATYFGGKRGDFGTGVAINGSNNIFISGFTYSTNFTTTAGAFQTVHAGDYDAFLIKFDSSGGLLFSTLLGGPSGEFARSVALDHDGNAYLAGSALSATGVAFGGWQTTLGGSNDEFLAKFTSSGGFLWSTYLGGPGDDYCRGVKVDANNDVYITGYSNSSTGIAYAGFDMTWADNFDCTLTKYNASGTMQWSTYYGNNGDDNGNAIDFDADNNVYMAVQAGSSSGMAYNGFQMITGGGVDALVAKFSPSGNRIWATYYGGFFEDMAKAINIEGNAVYVAGHSMSAGLGYNGYENMISGYRDGFLFRLDTAGALIWATYAGGFFDEYGRTLAVLDSNTLYWGGKTFSYDYHTTYGSYQMAYGGGIADGFFQRVSDCPTLITFYADADDDGYGDATSTINGCFAPEGAVANALDCDDNNASRFPGNAEICNTLDDDCDGLIDNADPDITGQPVWHLDADGDLFGSDVTTILSCTIPVGYIATGGDCNDAVASINPSALESCNALDDDCDALIDEDVTYLTYYLDADGDGYGNGVITELTCAGAPDGYVLVAGDCNDASASIKPGATEICNTLDDDCDATIDEDVATATITPSGPTTFCKGSNVILQANTGAGYSYVWKSGATVIAGANSANYTVTKSGNYSVIVTVPGGCSATSAVTSVTVNSKPNPVITALGDLNICAVGSVTLKVTNKPGDTYQWYKNAVVIAGATSNTYAATSIGSYYVKETTAAGCSKSSTAVSVTSSCKLDQPDFDGLVTAPNPANDVLYVMLNATDALNGVISITNAIGQQVYVANMSFEKGENSFTIALPEQLSNGMYHLLVQTGNMIETREIIIAR